MLDILNLVCIKKKLGVDNLLMTMMPPDLVCIKKELGKINLLMTMMPPN